MAKIDPLAPGYTYLRVADGIAARIESGEFARKLPAERELAADYGVAYQTVRRSMRVLRDRGLIITRQGRGTFVDPAARRKRLAETTARSASADSPPSASPAGR